MKLLNYYKILSLIAALLIQVTGLTANEPIKHWKLISGTFLFNDTGGFSVTLPHPDGGHINVFESPSNKPDIPSVVYVILNNEKKPRALKVNDPQIPSILAAIDDALSSSKEPDTANQAGQGKEWFARQAATIASKRLTAMCKK